MRQVNRKFLTVAAAVAYLLATASATAQPTVSQERLSFDIPAQDASTAINEWARQSGSQVFAAKELLQGLRTKAVRGELTPIEAVSRLIEGTGLEVVPTGDRAYTLRKPDGTASKSSEVTLEEITITGSRIKRAGFDTLQPAVVTDNEEFERRGYVNVAQALNATPGFGTGMNGTGNQSTFGAAQTFVNFFGLGSNRTLTLVNGRRFVSSNTVAGGNASTSAGSGQQVDLNVIPAGLVARVETIAIGGAPIYGADAIAGTVNVILKDNFEGIQTSAQYGLTERGDAGTHAYRGLLGGNFAAGRGNAVIGLEYNEQEGLLANERLRFYQLKPNPANTGPADGIPSQAPVIDYGFGGITEGGLPFITAGAIPGRVSAAFPNGNYIFDASGTPLRFGANGDLVPLNRGTAITSSNGAPVEVSGGDRLDPAIHLSLVAPARRTLLNGMAHFDLTENVRTFVEAGYAHTTGIEPSDLTSFAAPTLTGTSVTLSVNNAFLSQQARNLLLANGVTSTFSMARNFNDIIDRHPTETDLDLQRFVGGFQGSFDALGEMYSWDISYNYGRSAAVTTQSYINGTRFNEAINAVVDAGRVVCASGNVACVPLNLFGEGAASTEAVDYVLDRGVATSTNTQKVATANLGGNLPFGIAAPIAFNIGTEFRREEGEFTVDGTLRAGSSLLGAALVGSYVGTAGKYDTREGYGELVVPLIADTTNMRGIKSLDFETAARYVDNSITGGDTTWSAGMKLAPRLPGLGDGLLFRGVFTHAIRAPAITELFSGQTPTQTTVTDPCSVLNYNQGPNPAVRQANCEAALAAVGAPPPGAFVQTTNQSAIRGFSQGNPDLENETADSWSIGVVYQPLALPGLRLAADYVKIELEDGITILGIRTLLTQCYDNNPGLSSPACSAFSRLTAAEAAASLTPRVAGDFANGFRQGYYNTSSRKFSGAILAGEYGFDFLRSSHGRVGAKLFVTDHDETVAFEGQAAVEAVGLVGTPKWRTQFNLGYSWNWLDIDWQTLWTSHVRFDRNATIELTPLLEVDDYMVSNVTFGARLGEKLKFQLGVNNVFDKDAPYQAIAANNYLSYDTLGRRYFATIRASF